MSQPVVSVLLPVYNHAQYLHSCLESIELQVYDNFEIIIVDDASTDSSWEILKRFEKRCKVPLTLVRHAANEGIASTMKELAFLAKGHWCGYMSDDDVWDRSFLSTMMKSLDLGMKYVGGFTSQILIDAHGQPLDSTDFNRRWGRENLLDGDVLNPLEVACIRQAIPIQAFIIRTESLRAIDWNVNSESATDLYVSCQIARFGRLRYVATPLCSYRVHGTQETSRPNLRVARGSLWVFERLLQWSDAQKLDDLHVVKERRLDALWGLAKAYALDGNSAMARKVCRSYFSTNPNKTSLRSLLSLALASMPSLFPIMSTLKHRLDE